MEMEDTEYVKHLDEPARSRYREKIAAHIGYDPYELKKSDFSRDLADLPSVEAMDITNFLVLQTSYYTANQMKAYKSLEAFNYFVCGWVNDLGTKEAFNKCRLVFARVSKCVFFIYITLGYCLANPPCCYSNIDSCQAATKLTNS